VTALWNRAGYAAYETTPAKLDIAGDKTYTYTAAKTAHDLDNNYSDDVYAVVANLKFDGISGSVYAAYATLDGESGTGNVAQTMPQFAGDAYWVGATTTISAFDPFTLKLSAAFGEFAADGTEPGRKGWNIQAKAAYKTAYGTPVLGAWYFSGDDKDAKKDNYGAMPSVEGAFVPTKWYHDGAKGLNGGAGQEDITGTWGIQAGIENVSFLKGLSHTFLISYIEGTNDDSRASAYNYLTTEDSFVAFDLINTYQIYKNLAAHLQLNYTVSDFEAKTLDEDDYGFELTFEYKF